MTQDPRQDEDLRQKIAEAINNRTHVNPDHVFGESYLMADAVWAVVGPEMDRLLEGGAKLLAISLQFQAERDLLLWLHAEAVWQRDEVMRDQDELIDALKAACDRLRAAEDWPSETEEPHIRIQCDGCGYIHDGEPGKAALAIVTSGILFSPRRYHAVPGQQDTRRLCLDCRKSEWGEESR